jgi:hypothetical protein
MAFGVTVVEAVKEVNQSGRNQVVGATRKLMSNRMFSWWMCHSEIATVALFGTFGEVLLL